MKITNNDLRRIIKEELNYVLNEHNFDEHNLIHDDGTPFTEQEKEQFEQILAGLVKGKQTFEFDPDIDGNIEHLDVDDESRQSTMDTVFDSVNAGDKVATYVLKNVIPVIEDYHYVESMGFREFFAPKTGRGGTPFALMAQRYPGILGDSEIRRQLERENALGNPVQFTGTVGGSGRRVHNAVKDWFKREYQQILTPRFGFA